MRCGAIFSHLHIGVWVVCRCSNYLLKRQRHNHETQLRDNAACCTIEWESTNETLCKILMRFISFTSYFFFFFFFTNMILLCIIWFVSGFPMERLAYCSFFLHYLALSLSSCFHLALSLSLSLCHSCYFGSKKWNESMAKNILGNKMCYDERTVIFHRKIRGNIPYI